MSKYNKSKIMTHAWNIVRAWKQKGRKIYIATAMKQAWKKAKDIAQHQLQKNALVKINPLDILKQTEKAICVSALIEQHDIEQSRTWNIWIPKSMITEHCVPAWLISAKCEEVGTSQNMRNCSYEVTILGHSKFVSNY